MSTRKHLSGTITKEVPNPFGGVYAPLRHVLIYRDHGARCWMVDHRVDPSAGAVRALFGCYALPAPFTAALDEEGVRRVLQSKNPGCIVTRVQDVR